jgi:transposase-like protein
VPRKVDDDCLLELRWMYDRRDLAEVRRDLAAWLAKWGGKYPNADSARNRPRFRNEIAHDSDLKSPTIPG